AEARLPRHVHVRLDAQQDSVDVEIADDAWGSNPTGTFPDTWACALCTSRRSGPAAPRRSLAPAAGARESRSEFRRRHRVLRGESVCPPFRDEPAEPRRGINTGS